jgi:hypothetical protein
MSERRETRRDSEVAAVIAHTLFIEPTRLKDLATSLSTRHPYAIQIFHGMSSIFRQEKSCQKMAAETGATSRTQICVAYEIRITERRAQQVP